MTGTEREALAAAAAERLVTIGPGEVLAVRLDPEWCDAAIERFADSLRDEAEKLGVRILVIPCDQFARLTADEAAAAADRGGHDGRR